MVPVSLFDYNQLWGEIILNQLGPQELGTLCCVNKELNQGCPKLPSWQGFLERDFAYYAPDCFRGAQVEFERVKCIAVNCMFSPSANRNLVAQLHSVSYGIPEQLSEEVIKSPGASKFYRFYVQICRNLLDLPHVKSFDRGSVEEIELSNFNSNKHAYRLDIPVYYLTCIDSSAVVEGDLNNLRQAYRLLSLFRKWVPVREGLASYHSATPEEMKTEEMASKYIERQNQALYRDVMSIQV